MCLDKACGGREKMASPAIGIDLGTTYSCVAVFQHDKAEIIANNHGNRTTPSYVAFTDTERLIGEVAKSQAARNAVNTVFDAKRMIGRQFNDPKVQQERDLWPFTVVEDRGNPVIEVEYKGDRRRFTAEEISSMVLVRMKETAEAYLGEKVTDAVITVPAYFNNQQRSATADAGKIAGLNVKRIINEPTAAALAYGLDKNLPGQRRVLIFDLGGGTFDVSILKISNGSVFEVLATAGDTHLGGQDFDNRMVKYFVDEFKRKYKKDLTSSVSAMRKLKAACEQAKRTLSSTTQAFIEIDSLYQGMYFSSRISRARFEELCISLFRQTLKPVEQAIRDAKLDKSSIDEVVLVGGSTRIPKVQQILRDFFDGKKLNMNINPDEAVAYGAAVQAAVLSDHSDQPIDDVLLRDVVPLSVGIEVGGMSMEKLIERNTTIPARHQKAFSIARDNQESACIRVLEGERALTKDNNVIGQFELKLSPHRRGECSIVVTFDIDANGILCVSATDKPTGRSMQVAISERNGRLSTRDIERMVKDAERFRDEDDAIRERIAAKGQLEYFLLSAQRAVAEAGDRVSAGDRDTVLRVCREAIDWIDHNSLAEKDELDDWLQNVKDEISPILETLGCRNCGGQCQERSSGPGVAAPDASSGFREPKSDHDGMGGEEVRPRGDAAGQGDFGRGARGRRGGLAAFEQALRDVQSGGHTATANMPSYPTSCSGDVMEEVD